MKNLLSVQEQLQSGKRKITDICEEYLQTIKETNSEVNAFVSVDDEDVRKQATNIQQKIDAGKAGKLAGMVIGVKDVICEKGKKVTCASHILHNFESVYDATVIKKLKNEDAILIGRTNMDEFAMGSSTENTIYGPSKNPANSDYVV